jgi:hypothetical protein
MLLLLLLQVGTALAAWQLVLCGRFRLLERWCSYVSSHHKANVVLEDTWRQVCSAAPARTAVGQGHYTSY